MSFVNKKEMKDQLHYPKIKAYFNNYKLIQKMYLCLYKDINIQQPCNTSFKSTSKHENKIGEESRQDIIRKNKAVENSASMLLCMYVFNSIPSFVMSIILYRKQKQTTGALDLSQFLLQLPWNLSLLAAQ